MVVLIILNRFQKTFSIKVLLNFKILNNFLKRTTNVAINDGTIYSKETSKGISTTLEKDLYRDDKEAFQYLFETDRRGTRDESKETMIFQQPANVTANIGELLLKMHFS